MYCFVLTFCDLRVLYFVCYLCCFGLIITLELVLGFDTSLLWDLEL